MVIVIMAMTRKGLAHGQEEREHGRERERETENKSCSHVTSLNNALEINSNFEHDHGEYSILYNMQQGGT